MLIDRRRVLAASLSAASLSVLPGRVFAQARADRIFTPEMFGAVGDGVTDDSAAFKAMTDQLRAAGGGRIVLRRTTYQVGNQVRRREAGRNYAYQPARVMDLVGCSRPVSVEGNNARIRCAPGLRFGTFDVASGRPTSHAMPFFNEEQRATPYEYMILVSQCTGAVTISDLELDGNLPNLVIGGEYGDAGRQIAGSGIFLANNRGDEIIRNVYTHHHPQDGIMIDGVDDPALASRVVRRLDNLRSEYNGRQGCSIIGGVGYAFNGCRFNHNARSKIASPPASGVDIEAEGGKRNRNFSFTDCEFVDNHAAGLVADSGDSEGVRFDRCRFVGTTNWSLWPRKPGMQFHGCTMVGSMVNPHGDADPRRATQFHDCLFTDDPAQSPNGRVFLENGPGSTLLNLSDHANVLFSGCRVEAMHGGLLPWSTGAIYEDCVMRQNSAVQPHPRGIYRGRNRIDSPNVEVNLYNSRIVGELHVNGQPVRPGEKGTQPR